MIHRCPYRNSTTTHKSSTHITSASTHKQTAITCCPISKHRTRPRSHHWWKSSLLSNRKCSKQWTLSTWPEYKTYSWLTKTNPFSWSVTIVRAAVSSTTSVKCTTWTPELQCESFWALWMGCRNYTSTISWTVLSTWKTFKSTKMDNLNSASSAWFTRPSICPLNSENNTSNRDRVISIVWESASID